MANRFSVEAVFKAVDRITAPINDMQNRVGKFTRSIEKNLRAVSRVTGKLTSSLLRAGKTLFKFGAVAVTAAITATGIAITKVANAADDLAKRADRLAFPIEEFQQWQFVAQQSGLSTEKFDGALENFTKNLGLAKLGTGTLGTTLKQFNPQVLNQLRRTNDSSKSFKLLIDTMRDTEDQSVKMALAAAAFGRTAGASFINISNQSADAIERLIQEQTENGLITLENAQNAEIYNEAINSLKNSLSGLLKNIILPLLPKLTEMILQFRQLIVTNRDFIISSINDNLLKARDIILRIVDALKRFNDEQDVLSRLIKLFEVLAKVFIFMVDNIKVISIAIGVLVGALVALNIVVKAMVIIMAIFNVVLFLNPLGLVVLGVLALAAAALTLTGSWSNVPEFFSNMWGSITTIFEKSLRKINIFIDVIKNEIKDFVNILNNIGGFFSFKTEKEKQDDLFIPSPTGSVAPQIISPEERVARVIQEQKNTNSSEITIRDESGRAEVTSGSLPTGINMLSSGAF